MIGDSRVISPGGAWNGGGVRAMGMVGDLEFVFVGTDVLSVVIGLRLDLSDHPILSGIFVGVGGELRGLSAL